MLHNVKNSVQIVGHVGKDVVLTSFENGNKKAIINQKGGVEKTTTTTSVASANTNRVLIFKVHEEMCKTIRFGA